MQDPALSSPSVLARILRLVIRLGLLAVIVMAVHFLTLWVHNEMAAMNTIDQQRTMGWVLFACLLGYALLLAIPFVPGVEVGIAILMLKGADAAPLVYGATVLGLLMAYGFGRYLPLGWLSHSFADLHMTRAAALVARTEAMTPEQRIDALTDRLPRHWGPPLLRFRYVMLAVLINLPGTAVIGGGGGILTIAGLSGLFRDRWVILTILLATLPVPLAVWLIGTSVLH